jgi:D-beta-D-heptose 7-phosphate kinase/D-beta-D-heptose 1-phosphate adenosyltransferase
MVSKKRILGIVKNFTTARVLVIGDLMVDHFIWGKVSRISPEAPVPVVEVARESLLLGGSANVMNNILSAGGRVSAAGVIGADDMGRWLLQECRRRKIGTEGIVTERNRPTTIKTRIVAHSQQMVRFDREKIDPIRQDSVKRIVDYVRSGVKEFQAIVVSDYNKGVVSEELLDGIRTAAAGRKPPVCVDPKRNDFHIYRGFDVITPNHHEAARAAGLERAVETAGDQNLEPLAIGEKILERYGFKAVLITRGEEGMDLFERGSAIHISAVAKEVYDVTGAGDTVIGLFALAVAAGANFKEAAYIANQAAGIVVGKVGTATVSQNELMQAL